MSTEIARYDIFLGKREMTSATSLSFEVLDFDFCSENLRVDPNHILQMINDIVHTRVGS